MGDRCSAPRCRPQRGPTTPHPPPSPPVRMRSRCRSPTTTWTAAATATSTSTGSHSAPPRRHLRRPPPPPPSCWTTRPLASPSGNQNSNSSERRSQPSSPPLHERATPTLHGSSWLPVTTQTAVLQQNVLRSIQALRTQARPPRVRPCGSGGLSIFLPDSRLTRTPNLRLVTAGSLLRSCMEVAPLVCL